MIISLIVVGVISYFYGWGNGVEYMAISDTLASGQMHLLIAKALRKGDTKEALKWTEFELRNVQEGLKPVVSRTPKQFAEGYSRISKDLKNYQDQYVEPSTK